MITTEQRGGRQVLLVLDELVQRMGNMRPALEEIGHDQVESIHSRFTTTKAPDGTPWAPNSEVTIDMYLGMFKGSYKKDGSRSKQGQARAGAKKPGTGETKKLQTTLNSQLEGSDTVSIGSPEVYAAMFNFGGTKDQFPHLWGDIPGREFLGFSDSDRANIVAIVQTYLMGA